MHSSNRNNIKRKGNNSVPRLTTILGSFLEVLTHELLYTRSLYPHDAFSPTRHYGVACHACRHPGVVDYIFDTLKIAVPSIISGSVDGLYLLLYDEQTDELLERFAFEFQLEDTVKIIESHVQNATEREELEGKVQQLERSLRDVLLKVVSLDGTELGRKRGQRQFTGSATFKLCLHTVQDNETAGSDNSQMRACPELDEAMKEGAWFRSDSESCQFNSTPSIIDTGDGEYGVDMNNSRGSLTRPLKSINVPSCGLRLELLMEFPK